MTVAREIGGVSGTNRDLAVQASAPRPLLPQPAPPQGLTFGAKERAGSLGPALTVFGFEKHYFAATMMPKREQ
jgi:hypothetical protein